MKSMISNRALQFRLRLRDTAKGKHGSVDMTREQAKEALDFLISDEADPVQRSAFLTAMRFKGTKLPEFLGFFDAISEYNAPVETSVRNLLNTNGPYDGRKKYLQLTPAYSMLASAAGVPVLLHSSTDLPPKKGVGSSHVLESLGIPALLSVQDTVRRLENTGFAFLHSSQFSFAIEKFRSVREMLFYRSFLHSCEVLMNPAKAQFSIAGAAHDTFLERFTQVQAELGAEHALTLQGLDGGDEFPMRRISLMEYKNKEYIKSELSPEDFGLKESTPAVCKTPSETADIILRTFDPRTASKDDSVWQSIVYNAGIRIWLGRKAPDIKSGILIAESFMSDGKAMEYLEKLRKN
jgi:anthranilate phosphoribosyltransferase